MAKGFDTTKPQNQETTATANTERVDYPGKTAQGFANHAGKRSVEERMNAALPLAQELAQQMDQDIQYLASRMLLQSQANGSTARGVVAHLSAANNAVSEQNQAMRDQIDSFFTVSEVKAENFTKALSGASSFCLPEGR
jgi:hypothetical protein